ncbi:MAG: hypothetical protein ACOCWO_05260 [Candidatus Muiribacteriaceae bacterium]
MARIFFRKKRMTFLFVITVLSVFFIFSSGFRTNVSEPGYNVKLKIEPFENGNYIAEFRFIDINTGVMIANPKIVCRDSEKATVSMKGDVEIEAGILIMKEMKEAEYSVSVMKNGDTILRQEAALSI